MDLESVKRFLEKEGGDYEFTVDSMPERFIEPIVMQGLNIDHIERGRILCSFTVPPRLLVCISVLKLIHRDESKPNWLYWICCGRWMKNTGNTLHGGATAALVDIVGSAVIYTMGAPATGVSVEINVSYLDGASLGVSFYLPFSF